MTEDRDKARLDWLESHHPYITRYRQSECQGDVWHVDGAESKSLRDAVDACMDNPGRDARYTKPRPNPEP